MELSKFKGKEHQVILAILFFIFCLGMCTYLGYKEGYESGVKKRKASKKQSESILYIP